VFKVTADTNIYLSALNFGGKPLELLELARAGKIELAISNAIITEMSRILYNKFAWSRGDIAEAIDVILAFTIYVHPDQRFDVVASDPDDNRVLECAAHAGSQLIVTGDTHLLMLRDFGGIRILSVADFLIAFRAGGG
jgi:putative PIN family toxin of toxin-antitoxin system